MEFTPIEVDRKSEKVTSGENPLSVEGLRNFGKEYLTQFDNKTDPDPELVAMFPDRYWGKLSNGTQFSIQLTGEEKKVTEVIDGKEREVKARIWITNKNGKKSDAVMYNLIKGENGNDEWVVEKSYREPDYNEDTRRNTWYMGNKIEAGKGDMLFLKNTFEDRKNTRARDISKSQNPGTKFGVN